MLYRHHLDFMRNAAQAAEDKPMLDAAEARIDAELRAKYRGHDLRVDLSGISPAPTDRVLDTLKAKYSEDGTGFVASWKRQGNTVTFLLEVVPIREEKKNDRRWPARGGAGPFWLCRA